MVECDVKLTEGKLGMNMLADSNRTAPAIDCNFMSVRHWASIAPARDSIAIDAGARNSKERVGDSNLK